MFSAPSSCLFCPTRYTPQLTKKIMRACRLFFLFGFLLFTPAGDRTSSRLRRSARHARAFGARSRRCAPAAGAARLPQKSLFWPLRRRLRRRGPKSAAVFSMQREKCRPSKKERLGIFAHRWFGHLLKLCPMKFCLRDPEFAKKLILEPPISASNSYAGGAKSQNRFF